MPRASQRSWPMQLKGRWVAPQPMLGWAPPLFGACQGGKPLAPRTSGSWVTQHSDSLVRVRCEWWHLKTFNDWWELGYICCNMKLFWVVYKMGPGSWVSYHWQLRHRVWIYYRINSLCGLHTDVSSASGNAPALSESPELLLDSINILPLTSRYCHISQLETLSAKFSIYSSIH